MDKSFAITGDIGVSPIARGGLTGLSETMDGNEYVFAVDPGDREIVRRGILGLDPLRFGIGGSRHAGIIHRCGRSGSCVCRARDRKDRRHDAFTRHRLAPPPNRSAPGRVATWCGTISLSTETHHEWILHIDASNECDGLHCSVPARARHCRAGDRARLQRRGTPHTPRQHAVLAPKCQYGGGSSGTTSVGRVI
jgi:hypothetical protein